MKNKHSAEVKIHESCTSCFAFNPINVKISFMMLESLFMIDIAIHEYSYCCLITSHTQNACTSFLRLLSSSHDEYARAIEKSNSSDSR